MGDPLDQIREYLHIEDDIYTSGQPTEDQIPLLTLQKFEIIINLATIHSPEAIKNEQELVMDNGMAYVHIPVEWSAPTRENLEKFFHFFSSYHQFKTFVHCAKNMRVSSFIFLYRTLQENKNPQVCLADLLTIWNPNSTWQTYMDRMLVECNHSGQPLTWKVDWRTFSIVQA